MPVITITHEMGSLAKEVALELARTQNLAVMRHEVVDHVAEKMHVSKSMINRLREGKAGMVERLTADKESIALYTAEELFELAQRGNVVLRGWGATCLLHPISHVVCVRITRPMPKRVEWLMSELDTDDAEFAESEIRRSDGAHSARMHHQFGVTWGDPVLYDLVLNTDRVSVASCVEQIMVMAGRPEFQETIESRAALASMTLEAHIRATLRGNASTHESNITIEAGGDHVILRGIVLSANERTEVERVALAVPGVADVDNQLRIMSGSKLFTSAKYL